MTEQSRPTLYMIVGLPGSGKTTKAKELEADQSALRLTPDEWILTLFGNDLDRPHRDAIRTPVEAVQWEVAQRALSLGCNVVLDWGFWSRSERARYRSEAEALGAQVKVVPLEMPIEKLWERISARPESGRGTLHITRQELDEWATRFEPPDKDEL